MTLVLPSVRQIFMFPLAVRSSFALHTPGMVTLTLSMLPSNISVTAALRKSSAAAPMGS